MATPLGPEWLPNPLTEEYVGNVTVALKVREDTRQIQRVVGPPRRNFMERLTNSEPQCAYACSVGMLPANRASNRYGDVIAYDRTRVRLPGFPESHYFNANWVRERAGGRWHIATQAPLPTTAYSFLSLFLSPQAPPAELRGSGENVRPQTPRTIVQLTQNMEKRVTKASPYFPSEVGQSMIWTPQAGLDAAAHPMITIQLVAVEQEDCWQHSTLRIAYENKPSEGRLVRHLLFQGWPDHGVPSDIRGYLRFMKFVDACNLDGSHPDVGSSPNPPLVINCSAGVGRTGTFIALSSILRYHHLNQARVALSNPHLVPNPPSLPPALPKSALGKLDERFRDDVIALEIDSLREQRMMMVQTAEQVRFVYVAFLAAWKLAVEVEEGEGQSSN